MKSLVNRLSSAIGKGVAVAGIYSALSGSSDLSLSNANAQEIKRPVMNLADEGENWRCDISDLSTNSLIVFGAKTNLNQEKWDVASPLMKPTSESQSFWTPKYGWPTNTFWQIGAIPFHKTGTLNLTNYSVVSGNIPLLITNDFPDAENTITTVFVDEEDFYGFTGNVGRTVLPAWKYDNYNFDGYFMGLWVDLERRQEGLTNYAGLEEIIMSSENTFFVDNRFMVWNPPEIVSPGASQIEFGVYSQKSEAYYAVVTSGTNLVWHNKIEADTNSPGGTFNMIYWDLSNSPYNIDGSPNTTPEVPLAERKNLSIQVLSEKEVLGNLSKSAKPSPVIMPIGINNVHYGGRVGFGGIYSSGLIGLFGSAGDYMAELYEFMADELDDNHLQSEDPYFWSNEYSDDWMPFAWKKPGDLASAITSLEYRRKFDDGPPSGTDMLMSIEVISGHSRGDGFYGGPTCILDRDFGLSSQHMQTARGVSVQGVEVFWDGTNYTSEPIISSDAAMQGVFGYGCRSAGPQASFGWSAGVPMRDDIRNPANFYSGFLYPVFLPIGGIFDLVFGTRADFDAMNYAYRIWSDPLAEPSWDIGSAEIMALRATPRADARNVYIQGCQGTRFFTRRDGTGR